MSMDAHSLARIRNTALDIAREAAALALTGYRCAKSIEKKGVVDLVTEFDLKCEKLLRTRLAAAFPDHDVVAEEGTDKATRDFVWYVDPIDGTTNYAHGHPVFAISLGLAHKGEPIVGVVVAPALQIEWTGARGSVSTRNGEPCHVADTATLDDALCATGFPYDVRTHPDNNVAAFLESKMRTQGMRRCGAASIDTCFVADGTYGAYWEIELKPWDVCAAIVVTRGAGGRVTDTDGKEATSATSRIVASNVLLHDELLKMLAPFEKVRVPR